MIFIPGTKLSAASALLGRNKRIMHLNLKDSRSIKIIHQLLAEYDIVIEQFRPGVMAKLGLKKEQNLKSKPKHLLLERLSKKKDGLLQ